MISDHLTQCLIFFKADSLAGTAHSDSHESSLPTIKAYALLPEVFTSAHPDVVRLLQQENVHVARNADKPPTLTQDDVLEIAEIYLDGSNSRPMPFSVIYYDMDSKCLPSNSKCLSLIFSSSIIQIESVSLNGTNLNVAVDESNRQVFVHLLSCRFRVNFSHYGVTSARSSYLQVNEAEGSLLHWAAYTGQANLVSLLLDQGADVDAGMADGSTPLHVAAMSDSSSTTQLLLDKGATVDAKDNCGLTSLLVAKHPKVMEILIQNGADVRVTSLKHQTPLHRAAISFPPRNLKGAGAEHRSSVVQLLIEKGATVNAREDDSGYTPLHHAICGGYEGVAEILIRNGAYTNVKVFDGSTALHEAIDRECPPSLVRLLIKSGAAVNVRRDDGRTPLHAACCPEIAELLLKHGADVNVTDFKQRTPIYLAAFRGDVGVVEVLLKHGARVYLYDPNKSAIKVASKAWGSRAFEYLLDCCFADFLYNDDLITLAYSYVEHYRFSSEKRRIFERHLMKLSAANIDVQKIKTDSFDRNGDILFGSKCEQELSRMKSQVLGNSTVTVHDILVKYDYQVSYFLRNEHVAQTVDSEGWVSQFPIYGSTLTYRIDKGKRRNSLQEEIVKIINLLFSSFDEIPDEIKDVILSYLSIEDFMSLKRAWGRPTSEEEESHSDSNRK